MKLSYTSNEMTKFAAHIDVLKKYMMILKMCCSVNQIDDLQNSNKKTKVVMDLPSSMITTDIKPIRFFWSLNPIKD